MGCGGSKRLEPEEAAIPERLRPLLKRRFEEIKNKRREKATHTLSKKELLAEGHVSDEDDDHRSESSEEGNLKVAPAAEQPVDDHQEQGEKGLVPVKVSELSSPLSTIVDENTVVIGIPVFPSPEADENDQASDVDNARTAEVSREGSLKVALEAEEGNEEEEVPSLASSNANEANVPSPGIGKDDAVLEEEKEEGRVFSFKMLLFPPGSPSFRVYLPSPSTEGDDNGNNDTKVIETVKESPIEKESPNKEDEKETEVASKSSEENVESVHPNEAKKRGKRGLWMRGKLARPKTSGMKNLFNVRSCYSPCSGHDATLLQQKAVA